MNPERESVSHITTITYDARAPSRPAYQFEHDGENSNFRIRRPDGGAEVFRDKPVRYLVVEPDAETGGMTPVVEHGQPTCLYLCRAEREVP
jgi:hypothetical protein